MRSYGPHLEERDTIRCDDWSHSPFIRRSPSWGKLQKTSNGDLRTAPRILSLSPLSLATDVTDVTLGASGLWVETRTGTGGTATLTRCFSMNNTFWFSLHHAWLTLYIIEKSKKFIFCPSWYCAMTYYNSKFTLLCKIFYLLEYSAEAFWCHVHHYQSLVVLVELSMIMFIFWSIGIGMAQMLVWPACVIMLKLPHSLKQSQASHTIISAILWTRKWTPIKVSSTGTVKH